MQVSHILTVCHLINLIFVVLLAYLALLNKALSLQRKASTSVNHNTDRFKRAKEMQCYPLNYDI